MDMTADMLTRIRNAGMVKHKSVKVNFSKFNRAVLDVLAKECYIGGYKEHDNFGKKFLEIEIKYFDKSPVISMIKKISLPGCRAYAKHGSLFDDRRGLYVLSTSFGVMSHWEAFSRHIGGEVVCYVF